MKSEISAPETAAIDWSKGPQLVKYLDANICYIVMTEQHHHGALHLFTGTVVFTEGSSTMLDGIHVGYRGTNFTRESFSPFDGSVTLKND